MSDTNEVDFGRMKILADPDLYAQVQPIIHSLEEYSQQILDEFPLMDGLFDDHKEWQIRTGIIQDPNMEVFTDRDGSSAYSSLDSSTSTYPFNGLNAIEPFGFKVSVVWVDGYDGGMFNGSSTQSFQIGATALRSSVTEPVQRVLLTFPNVWADMDRCCGDLTLPVAGTVCRIGMARNNVGVYLGAIPLDRSKLPNMRLGEFLRRHYTQSCNLLTDRSLKDSRTFLDKDIFKPDLLIESRPDTEDHPKPYETDNSVLSSLSKYHSHRHIIGSDGIESSVKKEAGKHNSIDKKRVYDLLTNKSLSDCIDDLLETVAINDILSLRVVAEEGILNVTQDSNHKHIIELTTNMGYSDALGLITTKFTPKSATINSSDGLLQFTCTPIPDGQSVRLTLPSFLIKTNSKTLLELFPILSSKFDLTLTVNCDISCSNAQMSWVKQIGTADSCLLEAAVLLVQVTNIVGRPPKYFTVAGWDAILVGNNNVENCGPRPVVPVDTCEVVILP